ncbi:hypothetical protein FB451DRAFT_1387233 [Mycena latifolia]|nr:hypothetical protein FB451DRAFT_1387233 [Mycena latifolia]
MTDGIPSFLPASAPPHAEDAGTPTASSTAAKQAEAHKAAFESALSEKFGFSTIVYVTSDDQASKELEGITAGAVGSNTEIKGKYFVSIRSHTNPHPGLTAYPKELHCIIASLLITKVGVGILNDAVMVWEDLQTDMENLMDVGLITRLETAENHLEEPFAVTGLGLAAK